MIGGKKPVMSKEVERQIMNAVTMFAKRVKWKSWGMHKLRKQGAAILLKGPPGTGKTVIAKYLSLRIRQRGIKSISFADFGSHVPGENARQIRQLFEEAHENGEMTVFLDECEAVLWDRSRAGATAMWMLEVIDELLVQIGNYSGLTILSTNKPDLLDEAIDRRVIATIVIPRPEYPERVRLWQDKLPPEHPLKLSIDQTNKLATLQLTGAEIENALIEYSSDCIRTDKKPTFKGMLETAHQLAEQIENTRLQREATNRSTPQNN
jgi:SpoVK/Ycf46/Vps4 family AAA+-type ATPase